ncbi:sialidase family protein [Nonomuraea turcica]|uniref:sialidase family protein n=1 Tax=Nonomuraea sp. G32 TaxID=3067274 RepID=UPI00273BC289|nr:sialidase family protein [Nonomuraea sp. G32]MDP4511801.1 sialidase family protein [Nonomuraea sp. G32]
MEGLMRFFRAYSAVAAAVMAVAVGVSPATAAQSPTRTWHKQTLWKQYTTTDPATGGQVTTCFRLPAVVKTKNDVLLAFAERRNKNNCADHGAFDVVMRRSTDNGVTWEASRTVLASTTGAALQGNATVVADSTGPVFLFTTSEPTPTQTTPRTPKVQISHDDGKTWSAPKDLSDVIKAPAGAGDWFATGPGHGIQLTRPDHEGRLVVPVYFAVGSRQSVRLIYSDDHGENWKIGATATYDKSVLKLGEQTLVERTDGSILVIARNGAVPDDQTSVHGLAKGVSRDGGLTFDGGFRADNAITAPPTHPALLRQRWDGGPYTRILLSVPATPKTNNNPVGMNVRSSFDEGMTWRNWDDTVNNAGVRIDDDHAGYSDMTLIGNGAIGVLYEAGAARFRDEIRWNWFWESAIGLY